MQNTFLLILRLPSAGAGYGFGDADPIVTEKVGKEVADQTTRVSGDALSALVVDHTAWIAYGEPGLI